MIGLREVVLGGKDPASAKIGKVQLFFVEHCLVSDQLEVGKSSAG